MQEKTPVETNLAAQLDQNEASTSPVIEAAKRPFVEPKISLPGDVLEATAFFQGSAALGTADI